MQYEWSNKREKEIESQQTLIPTAVHAQYKKERKYC